MNSLDAIKAEFPYYQEVIFYYKTTSCPKFYPSKSKKETSDGCNAIGCFHFHDLQERRRSFFDQKTSAQVYEPQWCPSWIQTGQCSDEDACKYSHTQNEIDYHPLNYKTKPCTNCQFASTPNYCPNFHQDEGSRAKKVQAKKNRENSSQRHSGDQRAFNLDTFKTKQCTSKGNHNPKSCLFFHSDKDRRRSLKLCQYGPELCSAKNNSCPKGDNCDYAHNLVEQLYHPDRYKRKFCSFHPHKIHKCDYGAYCSFAHSEGEIKIELLHNLKKDRQFYLYKYKTTFCPYNSEHDRNQCPYAHNPQDLRRSPETYKYKPTRCQFWTQHHISSYEEGKCPKLMTCENCHGWKELEYHPALYKTKHCINGVKCTKLDCPHFHPERDGKDTIANQADFGAIAPPSQSFSQPTEKSKEKFYDHFTVTKPVMKNHSNFQGPIKLKINEHMFEKVFQREKVQKSRSPAIEESTRSNSNSSSLFNLDGRLINRFAKKKQMSLQNQTESSSAQFAAESAVITQGKSSKRGSSAQITPGEPQIQKERKASENFEERKDESRFKKFQTPGSLESLDNFLINDKNWEYNGQTDKTDELSDEQFKWALKDALQKNGLDYTTEYLLNPMSDCQWLRLYSANDFNRFPHISFEDQEKIALIIAAIVDEEMRSPKNEFQSPIRTK